MLFSLVFSALFCGLAVSAVSNSSLPIPSTPSNPLLQWNLPSTVPEMVPAFQAKIDWDLDNVSVIMGSLWTQTHVLVLASIASSEPYNPDAIRPPWELVESRVRTHILYRDNE